MSELERLIQELCPNGVEYVSLGTVCTIGKGVQFNKADMNDEGTYPVINGGINPSGYIEQYNQDENTITISQGGASAGYVNWLETKFWAGAHCYIIKPKASVLNRYAYHFVKSQERKLQECQYGAGIPALAKGTVESLSIPVPPIEVQSEVIRILDNFTALVAELAAELTARKKQYDFYQDFLLNRNAETRIERLGDTCIMKSGKAISAANINKEYTTETPYQCFGGNGVRGYVSNASHHGEYPIIGRQGALCGNVNYASGDFYATEHAVVVESKGDYLQRFLYYLLTSMNLNQYKSQGAQPGLSVGNIENLLAPVPTLDEQKKIVAILDRFDAICNDGSAGLPAEIEARQKQYEYYRDKLLNFKEMSV